MKNNEDTWPLWESLGSLTNLDWNAKTPKILKDIGIGASLYLLTIKAFAGIFVILSIINIPIFVLYSSGIKSELQAATYFSPYMIGNIGESAPTCIETDFSRNTGKIKMQCPTGVLKRIEGLGMIKSQED